MTVRSQNENYQLWYLSPNGWSPEDPQPSDSKTYSGQLLAEDVSLEGLQEKELILSETRRVNFDDEFSWTEVRYPKSYVAPVVDWHEANSDIPF